MVYRAFRLVVHGRGPTYARGERASGGFPMIRDWFIRWLGLDALEHEITRLRVDHDRHVDNANEMNYDRWRDSQEVQKLLATIKLQLTLKDVEKVEGNG